jgi:hypothetical protein
VKHLLYAIGDVRDVLKQEIRPEVCKAEGEEKEKKQEKNRVDGIKYSAHFFNRVDEDT